jgi:Fur family ferric uptake transcriptional regulator
MNYYLSLLDRLERREDENRSVGIILCAEKDHVEVELALEEMGKPIGVTTVYRQLDKMVEEGIVNKYTLDSKSSACYEYVDEHDHSHGLVKCYHCKCDKCGKVIHLHCSEIEEIFKHIEDKHEFVINSKRTVLYGLCEECRKAEA